MVKAIKIVLFAVLGPIVMISADFRRVTRMKLIRVPWVALFLFLSFTPIYALGKNHFRIETLQSVKFILPPKSKLGLKDIKGKGITVKDKHRYHFVGVEEPGGDYLLNVGKVDSAFYYYDKRETGKNKPTDFKIIPGCEGLCAVSQGWGMLIVRIDYQGVFQDPTPAKITGAFNKIATVLLRDLSRRGWAAGTSQKIVETVFELIPVPQDSELARYALRVTVKDSFILLSPQILLRVDQVKRLQQAGDFQDQLVGSAVIRVYRGPKGELRQQPFVNSTNNIQPTNVTQGGNVLQASSGDILFSEPLKGRPYAGLYISTLKRNNNFSSIGQGCLISDDVDRLNCNSILLHTECLACLLDERTYETLLQSGDPNCEVADCERGKDIKKSSFGIRALITPVFNIYINGNPLLVELNSTLQQISGSYRMPAGVKIYRLRHGKYYPFKRNSQVTLLLPGDNIIF